MATMQEDSSGEIPVRSSKAVFLEDALIVMKGKLAEYSTMLDFVRSIHLSDNNFSGEIPEEMTCIRELQSLNLSHNSLSGKIPVKIGSMRSLESLDLCQNQLSGEIPQSLGNLSFLSRLNVSRNKLSGRIPLGTQLQSLDASSFIGNEGLCGPPLTRNCRVHDAFVNGNGGKNGDNGLKVEWFYVSTAVGFAVGFWVVIVLLWCLTDNGGTRTFISWIV